MEPTTQAGTEVADGQDVRAVRALGDLVAVFAHPDDESYLTGGLFALAAAAGSHVTCVSATAGDHADTPAARRAAGRVRRRELASAMSVLGVHDVVVLGHGDGRCASVETHRAVAEIAAILRDRRPSTVVTFGPDGFTGHPDHRTVSRWTVAAVAEVATEGLDLRVLHPAATAATLAAGADVDEQFDVFEPGTPTVHRDEDLALELRLDGALLDQKLGALLAHASQTAGLVEALGTDRYRSWIATESFVDAHRWRHAAAPPARSGSRS